MADKGSGTPENPGTLSNFHTHKDGSQGWDAYSPEGEKIHISTSGDVSKDDDRNRGILSTILSAIFGK